MKPGRDFLVFEQNVFLRNGFAAWCEVGAICPTVSVKAYLQSFSGELAELYDAVLCPEAVLNK